MYNPPKIDRLIFILCMIVYFCGYLMLAHFVNLWPYSAPKLDLPIQPRGQYIAPTWPNVTNVATSSILYTPDIQTFNPQIPKQCYKLGDNEVTCR